MRAPRPAVAVTAGLVALLAVAALVAVLGRRDSATVHQAGAPGRRLPDQGHRHLRVPAVRFRYASDPPASGPHVPVIPRTQDATLSVDELIEGLELGDVVIRYGDPADRAALLALAARTAGPFTHALAASGQAVILDHRPGWPGITAVAWRQLLHARTPDDRQLQTFVEAWLGRGATR